MKQLESQFTHDNNVFTQLKRNDKAALYRRETLEGGFVSFEVFAIRSENDSEVYPQQNAMSVWAWCPISEARANTYFDRIAKGEITIPDVDPETGISLEPQDTRSLDEIPDVVVATDVAETDTVVEVFVEEVLSDEIPEVSVEDIDPTAPSSETDGGTTPEVSPTPDGGAVVTVAKVRENKVQTTMVIPNGEFTQADIAQANDMPERGAIWGRIKKEIEAGRVKLVEMRKVGKGRPTAIYSGV